MGKTSIEWTDASWNPVTGCKEISPGCANCYAARLAATRLKNHPDYQGLAILREPQIRDAECTGDLSDGRKPRWTGEVRLHPDRLEEPLHWRKPRKIFVCDMSDLFHEAVPAEFIVHVFAVMSRASQHTFQVLTKRPERMRAFLSRAKNWEGWMTLDGEAPIGYGGQSPIFASSVRWPLPNVWIGVSVENQHFADERIPALLATPAAVRFISAEPLLGPIFLKNYGHSPWNPFWVICGGESGPGARPMYPDWARSLRDQCQAAGVPFFFKQWGGYVPCSVCCGNNHVHESIRPDGVMAKVGKKKAGRLLDGREWNEFPNQ